jgi:hypothetical protein
MPTSKTSNHHSQMPVGLPIQTTAKVGKLVFDSALARAGIPHACFFPGAISSSFCSSFYHDNWYKIRRAFQNLFGFTN